MPDFRYPKSRRLLKSTEFDRVFKRRRSQADGVLLIYACENQVATTRLGLVVARKCGGAVERSRWKRCIREAFRLMQNELPPGVDFVVLPRPGARPTMPRVMQSFRTLSHRLSGQLARSTPGQSTERPPL